MAVSYTWDICSLDCFPEWNGNLDVVARVHWQCVGTDGELSASVAGCTSITPDPDAEFTPFEKLTPDEVAAWVKAALADKPANPNRVREKTCADYEAEVAQLIDQQRTPAITTPSLPWST